MLALHIGHLEGWHNLWTPEATLNMKHLMAWIGIACLLAIALYTFDQSRKIGWGS